MHDHNLAEQVDRLERRFERLLDFILEDHPHSCSCDYCAQRSLEAEGAPDDREGS